MKNLLFTGLVLFFLANSTYAQRGNIDSTRFANERAKVLATYTAKPDSAIIYSRNIIRMAQATDNVAQEAWGLKMIGISHQIKQGFDSALVYFKLSKVLFIQAADSLQVANSDLSLAQMYLRFSEFDKALEYNMMALESYEALGETRYLTQVNENIGQTYSLTGDHKAALPYFHKAYSILVARKDTFKMGVALANFVSLHNYLKNEDSVVYYAELAKPILSKTGNVYTTANVELTLGNMYKNQGKFKEAERGYEIALDAFKKTNVLPGLTYTYFNYGMLKDTLGRLSEAREYYEESLKLSKQMGITDLALFSSERLKKVFAQLGDYRKAYAISLVNDSIREDFMDAEKQEAVTSLQVQFDVKDKEQQIALQEATLGEQEAKLERNQVLILSLILITILLIVVLLLLRMRSQKEKALIKREAELKLREAEISAVINSQEKERNRFARDLHDGFGQMISVLKLNLGQLKDLNNRDLEKREEVFKSGEKVIKEMYSELRNICFDLMPQTLVKQGLGAALREFGDRVNQNTSTRCEVMLFDLEERLPELLEISLFRTTQEWVNNVLKYAEAAEITIQVTREQNELTLTIEDDGNGFEPDVFFSGTGNGWRNIQTRLKQVNGHFDLDSRAGYKGSMVTINLDLSGVEIPTGTEEEITA